MTPLKIYESLVKLKDDPEKFEEMANEIWESYFTTLTEDEEKRARQFKWHLDGQLRGIVDTTARMNKMVELFWEGFQTFQLSLTNPDQLIARSQDGSKAVVLPIDRKSH